MVLVHGGPHKGCHGLDCEEGPCCRGRRRGGLHKGLVACCSDGTCSVGGGAGA